MNETRGLDITWMGRLLVILPRGRMYSIEQIMSRNKWWKSRTCYMQSLKVIISRIVSPTNLQDGQQWRRNGLVWRDPTRSCHPTIVECEDKVRCFTCTYCFITCINGTDSGNVIVFSCCDWMMQIDSNTRSRISEDRTLLDIKKT